MGYPGSDRREFYKGATDDCLSGVLLGLKEKAAELRQEIWYAEDELRDRLIGRNATVILAENYRVKSSVKREVKWDDGLLGGARLIAADEGRGDAFDKAFPLTHSCSVRSLNSLMKMGGRTAAAIDRARGEVTEKLSIVVEALSSGSSR